MKNRLLHKFRTFSHNPKTILEKLLHLTSPIWPDSLYLRLLYRYHMGRRLNLRDPETFSEKLNWLKLHDRNPLYTTMVDKFEVKGYVTKNIGEQYIIPTLGVYDSPEKIDFGSLPEEFVLKTTHGGGGIGTIICRNKQKISKSIIISFLNRAMKQNSYLENKEWPYKNVPRNILVEPLMQNGDDVDLTDYKFFCFNGIPHYCQVIANRSTSETIDFFDMDWKHQVFYGLDPVNIKPSGINVPKPSCFEEMIRIAKKLSKEIPFVRVDLYQIDGKVFFGELTFFPRAGFGTFEPREWNKKLGDLINIKNSYDTSTKSLS